MRIRLRLAKLLNVPPYGNKAVSQLASDMHVTRHQLMHALDEDSKQINRQVLEAICDYLIENELAAPADLPHTLFALGPHQFWSMIQSCAHVLLTMGKRWDSHWHDSVVVAADSMLHSTLVTGITDPHLDATTDESLRFVPASGPPQIDSRLVPSWVVRDPHADETINEAGRVMATHRAVRESSALVCIGSVKSNPVTELVLAHTFRRARPFEPEDRVADPCDRSCPFAFVYRPTDVHSRSCWAGERLHQHDTGRVPGIYYETKTGTWAHIPWSEDEQDGGLVVYRYDRIERKLDMVIGGFTGRATRCLAELLKKRARDYFWPPTIQEDDLDVGVFLVKMTARPDTGSVQFYNRLQSAQQIALSPDAILPRLARSR